MYTDLSKFVACQNGTPNFVIYYESHITTDYYHEQGVLDQMTAICKPEGFRVAQFALVKTNTDDFFATARDYDYMTLKRKAQRVVQSLVQAGINVRRVKIEAVVLDETFKPI